MRKNIITSVGGLLVLSALFMAAPAQANHSWGNYHWARATSPFTLQLGDNVSATWDSYFIASSGEWGESSVLDTTIVGGGTNAPRGKNTSKNCVPTSGRVEVCNSKYGSNGWLGVATIWASGDHIVQGTVKLNDSYFNTPRYNTPAWKNLVMCQEIAHTFGLDHQDETFNNVNLGTCMDYTSDPDGTLANPDQLSNEHPNAHDYEQLETIYAHFDSFATALNKTSARGGAAVDTSNQSEWGKAIRISSDGRASLYMRDLGLGQKMFTFVIWAD